MLVRNDVIHYQFSNYLSTSLRHLSFLDLEYPCVLTPILLTCQQPFTL